MHNFKELIVWQKACNLNKTVYEITKHFSRDEMFGLTSQIRRSAVSIPSNIAEGCGRSSNIELCRFLDIANGSSFELETQLILAFEVGIISKEEQLKVELQLKEIQKMLYSFKESKLKTGSKS
ncbi:MAG: four helix bundle protein [Salinivirgaceae bacterium]|nr:four helix bundle protein [Salinivirgaceae bacterium]